MHMHMHMHHAHAHVQVILGLLQMRFGTERAPQVASLRYNLPWLHSL